MNDHILYVLPPEVLSRYICASCGSSGVKLWRHIHDGTCGWCAACACDLVDIPNDISASGRREGVNGRTDQLYSSVSGVNLLPWVLDADGSTWGYTSVPDAGVDWWHALPLREVLGG